MFLGLQTDLAPKGEHQGKPVLEIFMNLGGIARPPGGDDGEALAVAEIDQGRIRDTDSGLLP